MKDKPDSYWKDRLDPQTYKVTRKKGTERAFSGKYHDEKRAGNYTCVCCGEKLFHSDSKFDSGTGWPSFYEPANGEAVETESDRTLFMVRTEVHCKNCGSHLGHVFDDGPQPTGKRYCINSVSLVHEDDKDGDQGSSE